MSIAAEQDMIDRFGEDQLAEVTTRSGSINGIVSGVLQTALNDATAEVESYVGGMFETTNTPRILIVHCAAIAWYRLLGDRAHNIDGAKENYDDAIDFLKAVRAGKASLGDETPADTEAAPTDTPEFTAPPPTFSRETFEGY